MATKARILAEYEQLLPKYPKLHPPEHTPGGWSITGEIDVTDDEGGYWDTYAVEIIIPSAYPHKLPELIETGGKIKRHEDWHNRNGKCCLSTEAIMFSELAGQMSLLNWIDKFAHPFLANHVYRKETGKYANGEFPHETLGMIRGYMRLFNVTTTAEVLGRLRQFVKTGRNEPCFCGSRKKYKDCYLATPSDHALGIPHRVLESDFNEIASYAAQKKELLKRYGID